MVVGSSSGMSRERHRVEKQCGLCREPPDSMELGKGQVPGLQY